MSHDPKFDAPEFRSSWRPTGAESYALWQRLNFPTPDICDECAEPIDETDLAPSCGAHRLHLDCRGRFDCRWCDEEWEDANGHECGRDFDPSCSGCVTAMSDAYGSHRSGWGM